MALFGDNKSIGQSAGFNKLVQHFNKLAEEHPWILAAADGEDQGIRRIKVHYKRMCVSHIYYQYKTAIKEEAGIVHGVNILFTSELNLRSLKDNETKAIALALADYLKTEYGFTVKMEEGLTEFVYNVPTIEGEDWF